MIPSISAVVSSLAVRVREWFIGHVYPEELAQWSPALFRLKDKQSIRRNPLRDCFYVLVEGLDQVLAPIHVAIEETFDCDFAHLSEWSLLYEVQPARAENRVLG